MRRSAGRRRRCGPTRWPRTPELAKIGTALGLYYQPGDTEIAHNLCTAIIDSTGKLARLEVGTQAQQVEKRRLPQDHLLAASGQRKSHLQGDDIPICGSFERVA